ncbi:hypothetical protein TUM4445_29040 [Shewanella sp. MBTL60-112-B2]|nr:hypothetical protein TUM4444_33350 [Shewanella sp. MBTL60-112-B1]GIU37099.1 hypothetical protein TUM4445_29040 [Shewanella sp. MBTL60-112-B2]
MRPLIALSFTCLLSLSCVVQAEPARLEINDNIKPKSSNRYIRAVHQEIETGTDDLNKVRYAILYRSV